MTKLLRLPEVAALTGIPENTLRFWRHQGTGPKSAKLGRRLVYREEDVVAGSTASSRTTEPRLPCCAPFRPLARRHERHHRISTHPGAKWEATQRHTTALVSERIRLRSVDRGLSRLFSWFAISLACAAVGCGRR